MKSFGLSNAELWNPTGLGLVCLSLGAGYLCATVHYKGAELALLCIAVLYLAFAVASCREPGVFILVFLSVLIVLPPLFLRQTGDIPIYVSTLLLPVGVAILFLRWHDFKIRLDPVSIGLAMFLFSTAVSLPFAFWFSGPSIAFQSLMRWLMLSQTLLLYLIVRGGLRECPGRAEQMLVPVLIIAAVVGAGYGIYDFIWPVPIPHPAAAQFLYLPNGMVRRAQGVLYESSSFGNLCGFFLVVTVAAFAVRKGIAIGVHIRLLPIFVLILSGAVIVAFSRSSWANILVAMAVFGVLARRNLSKRTLVICLSLAIPLVILAFYFPEIWNYFVGYRLGSLSLLLSDPNSASSGRFKMWARILEILYRSPQYFILGVGYKTLPFTHFFGQEIITDNGYLNLLLETGLFGLFGFLVFLGTTLKTFWKLAKSSTPQVSFWAGIIFAFWCGQCVQLLAADAYTYWRNMVVYVSFMALIMNRADREKLADRPASTSAPKRLAR